MRNLSRETLIKVAVLAVIAVAALGMFIWGQDRGDARIVISPGPPPTATPIPPSSTLPTPTPSAPAP